MVTRQVYYRVRQCAVAVAARLPALCDVAAERSNVKQRTAASRWPIGHASRYEVAILVPCYNEERAIAKVVADFRAALPAATVYVYDNNSTDGTVAAANGAGAVVRRETHQGKGYVVRRMFNDIEADIYVLVDGDATYDAPSAPAMIDKLVGDRLDMVVATRVDREDGGLSPRPSRRQSAADRLCRAYFRPRLHRYPVRLPGVLAPLREIVSDPVRRLRDRDGIDRACARARIAGGRDGDAVLFAAGGSASKLSTWHDGFRILWTVLKLYRAERPLSLFGAFGIALIIMSIGLAIPIFITYVQEGLVPRLPTAVLSTGLMLLAFLSIACGLILDTVTRGRREAKLIAYLALRAPGEERRRS